MIDTNKYKKEKIFLQQVCIQRRSDERNQYLKMFKTAAP